MASKETSLEIENVIFYILMSNGTILLLSLLQNWSSSDLFLFLFLQSVLQGIVTVAVLVLLNLQKNNIAGSILHSAIFLLHYYSFTAIIIYGVLYDYGSLSLQTLAAGLTTLFTAFTAENVFFTTEYNVLHITLTLGLFLLVLSYQSVQTYRHFNSLNRSYAEVHISAYSRHLLVFFFAFLCSTALLKPFMNSAYTSPDSSIANQAILITFFTTVSVIEIFMASVAQKLDLIR